MVGSLLLSSIILPLALTVRTMEQSQSSVPPGAQRVTMLSLLLTASCSGDVGVENLTVTHGGMGSFRDITSVYVMSGGERVTRGRALDSRDGSVTLSFRPALKVPACGSTTLSAMADFSSDAASTGEHRLSLAHGGIDAGTATVSIQNSVAPSTRTITGSPQGSVSLSFLPLLQRVTYGDRRTIARLRLSAAGTYDQSIDSVTLTNDGSARDADLQNLTLETSRGQVLARLGSLEGERAPFVLSTPLILERGQVFLLTVRADVRAGRRRTIGLILEEPGDLVTHRAMVRR